MISLALSLALALARVSNSTPQLIHHTNTPPTSIVLSNAMDIGMLYWSNSTSQLMVTTNLGRTWQVETNWDYFPIYTNLFRMSNFITGLVTNIATNYITNVLLLRYNTRTNGLSRFYRIKE